MSNWKFSALNSPHFWNDQSTPEWLCGVRAKFLGLCCQKRHYCMGGWILHGWQRGFRCNARLKAGNLVPVCANRVVEKPSGAQDIQSKVQRLKKDQRGSCAPIPTSPVWNICGSPDRPSWELCVHTHGPYMYQMFASDAPPPEVQKRPTWTWSIICFESVDTVQFLISKNRNTLKCIRFPLPSENRLNIFRGQIYYRMLNREKKPQIWGHITHDSEEDLQASIEAFPLPKSLS